MLMTIRSNKNEMTIVVLGMGHVGLPTALGFAEWGWPVVGADEDANKIAILKTGKPHFYEPGIEALLARHLESGKLRVTEDVSEAIREATVVFVCVGTPQREDGTPDLSQVETVVRTIAQNLNGDKLIVLKSTVPPVTGQWVTRAIFHYAKNTKIRKAGAGVVSNDGILIFDVASNPEFLREGRALDDIFHPDRIVIGAESDWARGILEDLYRSVDSPKVVTNLTTAGLLKHAANAFLATKISFINMVADLCEKVDADVETIARGLGFDPRIGGQFLQSGIGFGGFCLPKDLRALIHLAREQGVDCGILQEVERVNLRRSEALVRKIRQALQVLEAKTVAVWGLAYKPDTDDTRETPSLRVIEALLSEGASVRLYDPQAMENCKQVLPPRSGRVVYCSSPYEAARGAHAALLLTAWDEFRTIDFDRLHGLMEAPILVDGRNFFDPRAARRARFEYYAVGRAEGALDPSLHQEAPEKSPVGSDTQGRIP